MITENIDNELWKPVEGFERYEVSNMGRIKSLQYKGSSIPHVLTIKGHCSGYINVALFRNGKRERRVMLHRLVAEAFIPNPENKPVVDHINGNYTDNRVENLRWATILENIHNPNTAKKWIKLTEKDVKEILAIPVLHHGDLARLGRKYGCGGRNIRDIRKREFWKHVQP